ncbi:hypothetical protein IAD21_05067 [Abditibacteriota bacterium]|nr:hypothetical protein IAD21_05067 [Abditibacteriota bacterium]
MNTKNLRWFGVCAAIGLFAVSVIPPANARQKKAVAKYQPAIRRHLPSADSHRKKLATQVRPQILALQPSSYEFTIPHPPFASDKYPEKVELSVRGGGFRHGAVLVFDGQSVPTTFVSTTQLQASVPFKLMDAIVWRNPTNGPDSFHGKVAVVVRNPAPHTGTSRSISFVVQAWPID